MKYALFSLVFSLACYAVILHVAFGYSARCGELTLAVGLGLLSASCLRASQKGEK